MSDLQIEYRSPAQLCQRKRNYRKHSEEQVAFSAKILRTYPLMVPLLIDRGDTVVDGELILLAAREVGLNRVPVIVASEMSEGQLRKYGLLINKLAEMTEIDEADLALELTDITDLLGDPDLSDLGFEDADLDRILGRTQLDGLHETEIPPLEPGRSVAKHGDMWLLGKHRLLCGDALDRKSYRVLLESEQAQFCFSDVPYNVSAKSISGKGKHKHEDFVQGSGELSEHEFVRFLTIAMRNMRGVSADGSLHAIFMSWHHLLELLRAGKIVYSELKNIVTWIKASGGMGSLLRSQTEFIAIFKHGKAPHVNNVQLGKFGRNRTNAWHYEGMNTFQDGRDELLSLHPTVKPKAMIADAILDFSRPGAIVLDPFVGSGTTIIAAEAVDRRCYAMELDPLYVDVALRRCVKECGFEPVHAQSGKSFSQVEEDANAEA